MKRMEFIKGMMTGCCGVVMSLSTQPLSAQDQTQKPKSKETPCAEKVEFTKGWIQRFMKILDETLDESTRREIMQSNGKACYNAHTRKPLKKHPTPEEFVNKMAQYVGKENCYLKGNKIYYNYVQNPRGLKISEGYCLCPMVEDGPKTLSPTYCHCSVGYVGQMFKFYLGKTVKVDLLESLRNGGKKCRFVAYLS